MMNLALLICTIVASAIADVNVTEPAFLPDTDFEAISINLGAFNAEDDVTFQLYTKQNPKSYSRLIPDSDNIGHFDVTHPTRFIIHGWTSSASKMSSIKDVYLSALDYNVILVDWSGLASSLYSSSKSSVKPVGEYLAQLIDFLVQKGAKLNQIHIAGHSLGAHVAGVAGNRITSGKLGKITGMDPALPLYSGEDLQNRLDKSDAAFVEVIHTCGGLLGFSDPLGHADFYPNNGKPIQPGCGVDLAGACSHSRSHDYFAESIVTTKGFYGYQCSSWNDYEAGNCFKNGYALMGESTPTSASGVYYLDTASSSPYALG